MTQEELAAIRLIVREELQPLFDHIERLDVHIMELEELLEGDAVAREKNRVRQRRFKAKKKAQVTSGNVTHNGNVTFSAGNAISSRKVTLPPNRVTGNVTGSCPSSPPPSPAPLPPPLTPPSPLRYNGQERLMNKTAFEEISKNPVYATLDLEAESWKYKEWSKAKERKETIAGFLSWLNIALQRK